MSQPYPAHEGLQVAPESAPEVYRGTSPADTAPEVVPDYAPKITLYDAPNYNTDFASKPEAVEPSALEPSGTYGHPSSPPRKPWCGLSGKAALLVAAVALLVVVGAVVGGVVGSMQARKGGGSSPSPTKSPPPPVPTSGVIALNCPAINNTQYTAQSGSTKNTFVLYCLRDFTSKGKDLAASLAYSFDSCIDSCTAYNAGGKTPPCQALTFGANLTRYKDANCFLKTGVTGSSEYNIDDLQASALLLN